MATTRHEAKNLGLASLGAVLEYFDFQVYVFVAAAISVAFFPPGASPWIAQVQAFGIYAVGYLVRPIAGIIIAHYADRIGRKKLFVFTVLLMSVPTFLMGLLPSYAMIGWVAPALLLLLRILQGCAVGGELPGAAVFVSEHAPSRRLGVASGIFQGVTNCGLLMGAGAAALAAVVAGLDPAFSSMAWRLPFLLGGAFGLLAAYLRRQLQETPLFEKMKNEGRESTKMPLAVIVTQYRRQCIFALALIFVFSSTSGVYFQFLPVFLVGQLHFAPGLVFTSNIIGVIAFVLGMPLWGLLRDRIGWAATIVCGAVLNASISVWFFNYLPTLGQGDSRLAYALVVVGLGAGCIHAMLPGLPGFAVPDQRAPEWLRLPVQHRHRRVHRVDPVDAVLAGAGLRPLRADVPVSHRLRGIVGHRRDRWIAAKVSGSEDTGRCARRRGRCGAAGLVHPWTSPAATGVSDAERQQKLAFGHQFR